MFNLIYNPTYCDAIFIILTLPSYNPPSDYKWHWYLKIVNKKKSTKFTAVEPTQLICMLQFSINSFIGFDDLICLDIVFYDTLTRTHAKCD